jgi:hypothetical protein
VSHLAQAHRLWFTEQLFREGVATHKYTSFYNDIKSKCLNIISTRDVNLRGASLTIKAWFISTVLAAIATVAVIAVLITRAVFSMVNIINFTTFLTVDQLKKHQKKKRS